MILFKYVSMAIARKILSESLILFSRPSFLNDPFDCPVPESFPETDDSFELPGRELVSSGFYSKIKNRFKSSIWEQNTGILSLTRTASNQLMWAHYADSHKGVVIAIDTAIAGLTNPETNLIPANFGFVVYSRNRPSGQYASSFTTGISIGSTHHFALDHFEKLQRLFLTKPLEWAYEEEVRVVKCLAGLDGELMINDSGSWMVGNDNGRPLHCLNLPDGAVTEVYFGARAEKSDVEKLRCDFPNISYKQACLNQRHFSIEHTPIN